MALVEMKKIRLAVHKTSVTEVLRAIQKIGVVHFTEVTDKQPEMVQKEKTAFQFNYASSRLDFAVEFLSKYDKPKGKLRSMIEGSRVFITGTEIYKTANSFVYNEIIDEVQELEKKINVANVRLKTLDEEVEILSLWKKYNTPLNISTETLYTQTLFLTGEEENFKEFEDSLQKNSTLYNIEHITENQSVFTFLKENRPVIDPLFREKEIELVELPKRRGTPKEELERISRAKLKEIEKLEKYNAQAKKFAESLPQLKVVADYIYWSKQKHNLISRSMKTESVLAFEGWCPKEKISLLHKCMKNKSNLYVLEELELAEDEVPPVEIENGSLIKPFESVTRLYGLPGHKDLDPTPFLAGFFFIFFGLSLTDVGYGIVLFLLTASVLAFYRVPKNISPLIELLMYGGIASTIIGLFFGGYLGIDIAEMPSYLQKIALFDPIKEPLTILGLSLALGVIQILFGLMLKIVSEAKQGFLWQGILDQGPWILVFISLILFGANKASLLGGAGEFYTYLVYIAFASVMISAGRKGKGVLGKIFGGILGLYASIGFFSDVLSYSRLLALGLATSALAFAVNLIASMVEGVPVIGTILVVIILVGGHAFNLGVNLLGAFIHSSRLQFVEFFGKFITGTGRPYTPFKREERYVVIE